MANVMRITEAGRLYAAAHEAHYGARDLVRALDLYRNLFAAYPDSAEAGYAQAQIQNIVKSVVPKPDLLAAQADLALAHIQAAAPDLDPAGAAPVLTLVRGTA